MGPPGKTAWILVYITYLLLQVNGKKSGCVPSNRLACSAVDHFLSRNGFASMVQLLP